MPRFGRSRYLLRITPILACMVTQSSNRGGCAPVSKPVLNSKHSFLPFAPPVYYDVDSRSVNLFFPAVRQNMSQPQVAIEESVARPLTTLSEDEQMFRDSVREFAEGEIRKRVEEMDEQSRLDPALTKQCFELGLMGIETPEEYNGAGGTFFQAILAVEGLSRGDAAMGVFCEVKKTPVNNARVRRGRQGHKNKTHATLETRGCGAYR